MDIQQLFSETARLEASDLHLIAGYPPIVRIHGVLTPISQENILQPTDTQALIEATLTPIQKEILIANREVDYSVSSPAGRFRVNAYFQKGALAAAFRLIPSVIHTVEELGLPQVCHNFIKLRQGLILVTGPTGHGKSTTLATMINHINQNRSAHIITIEDPVEYVYPKGQSIISQREMHGDTHSWSIALRSVLREDPDVVLVGEMRDFETIAAAITIAETGHLVFATLHTNSAAQTVDRIVDVFPENQQSQVRLQLAAVIEGVMSLRLVPASHGRTLVSEVMTATPAVRTLIREGKTHQLDNIIQTSAEYGMMTLEAALVKAVSEGKITVEVAGSYALRPEELNRALTASRQR